MIAIATPQKVIDELLNNSNTIMLWKRLPYMLRMYSDANSYQFNDSPNNKIYLGSNNIIKAEGIITNIYNLHFAEKNSVGLQVFKSRYNCANEIYKEWCNSQNIAFSENNWIETPDFYEYLQDIGYFSSNYGVKLGNVKPYIVR